MVSQERRLVILVNIKAYNYFSSNEFKGLLKELKKKYITYGYTTGVIYITPDSFEEAIKLSKFLSNNIKMGIKNKIKVKDIQRSLDDSIFEGLTVDDIVFMFFPNIKSNKEIKSEKSDFILFNLNDLMNKYDNSNIVDLFSHDDALRKIRYLIDKDRLLLDNVLKSLNELPIYTNDISYLSIFSSLKTGNPHYFDIDTHESNMFIKFISYLFGFKFSNNRKIKIDILERVGILIDEVSNFCITYNLGGNEMLDSFKKNKTPLNISLANIPYLDSINCVNNKLLVIENPSFISRVIGRDINYSVIITSGNSNFVVYKILEKIKNTKIYFNGDFDPEGLVIAENFKRLFDIEFIGYNSDYYYNGISGNFLNETRLKKLNNVFDNNLCLIKDILLKEKLASYQEANYDKLLVDIERF